MSEEKRATYLNLLAWGLSLTVVIIAVIAWGDSFNWRFKRFSNYKLFPLFGLVAFSLMWAHYVIAAVRLYWKVGKKKTAIYFEVTSLAVLVAILAHPGLLWWQLWRDGLGLPPASYAENYVAPGLAWVATLGTLSLCVFLAYELRRFFANRSWWRYVQYASDVAILAIFYHGLRLGSNLQQGWFKIVWGFYGVALLLALIYIYWRKYQERTQTTVAKADVDQP